MSEISSDSAATVEAPAVEEAPSALPSQGRLADLRSRLTAKADDVFANFNKKSTPAPEAEPETPPSETPSPENVDKAVAKLTEAGVGEEVTEQKKTETKSQYETRIARLTLQLDKEAGEKLKLKKSYDESANKIKELESILEGAKKGPLEALKLAGWDFAKLNQAVIDGTLTVGDVKEAVAAPEIPPEVKELLEEAKRFKAEKAEREAEAKRLETRKKQVEVVETARASVVDKFPALQIVGSEALLDAYLRASEGGEEPEFEAFAGHIQDAIIGDAARLIESKGAVKALLAFKPELREALVAELGLAPAVAPAAIPAPATKPVKSLGSVPAEVPARSDTMSEQERKARMNAAAANLFKR